MNALNCILEDGEVWLQYAIKLNLLHESSNDLVELKKQSLSSPKIKSYLVDITDFHSILVSNHKNPDLPIHKLLFLLELGFGLDVPEIQIAVNSILSHKDNNGIYQSLTNIPKHFGGSGEDMLSWCLCDAPLLLFALQRAGVDYEKLRQGIDFLVGLHTTQGFPCTVSQELGKFRGPGRKGDCCPYATLIMLKLFSVVPEYRDSETAKETVMSLLSLWENSLERHPYMFYMGTDFRKLKAPSMWYDIVSVVDILSHFKCARVDHRFIEMVAIIKSKQNENGLFTPESVFQKFKGWDFGQKKNPSPYLTYLCCRIFERIGL